MHVFCSSIVIEGFDTFVSKNTPKTTKQTKTHNKQLKTQIKVAKSE